MLHIPIVKNYLYRATNHELRIFLNSQVLNEINQPLFYSVQSSIY